MKNKNIIRYGSIAGLVLILLYAFTFFSNDVRSFKQVDTSVAMQQLADKNVEEAQIDDREQQLRLKLKEPVTVGAGGHRRGHCQVPGTRLRAGL